MLSITAEVIEPAHEVETYRDEIKRASPPWLSIDVAEKFLYAWALHIDAFGDAVIAGVMHRFPGLYSFEALGLIGRERRINRGRIEDDPTFAGRLVRWLTDHRVRGGPYALLGQTAAHYAPALFPMDLVYPSGRRFYIDAAGVAAIEAGASIESVIKRDDLDFHTSDIHDERWARWFLFFYTDQYVDTGVTDAEAADLRLVPAAWNAAHCLGTIIIFSSTTELWDWPTGHVWNEPGTWNTTGHLPIYVPVDPDTTRLVRATNAEQPT